MLSTTAAPETDVEPSVTVTVSGMWYQGPCWTTVPCATVTLSGVGDEVPGVVTLRVLVADVHFVAVAPTVTVPAAASLK